MLQEIKPIIYDEEYLDILATADLFALGREKYLLTTRDLLLGIITSEKDSRKNMAVKTIQRAQYGFLDYQRVLRYELKVYPDQPEPFLEDSIMTESAKSAVERAKKIACTRSRIFDKEVINIGAIDLLLGIYEEKDSIASKVLRKCGLKEALLMQACDGLIFGNL